MSTTGQRNHITSILVQEDVFVGVFVMFSVHKLQEVNRGECAVRTNELTDKLVSALSTALP